ncbi:MAG: 5-(carboxyamino)imidazole ribonucleotide mutase [Eubacteriales bacterium]|nr:5-(carboxyamino)imidazole ribonucleotide mutase [Eubacteriales bacterium]MDD3880916.1 5-(carboxyamino)imidazole ribonucleotide mutase [Eubacteriales bacterium]MDD4511717.1 5-(carboxyamino)imidazole ribonucleotide mutase [Eubacteriales bacterium]
MPKAALIMGSKSDFPQLEKAVKTFKEYGVDLDAFVMSAHRTPDETSAFAKCAEKSGYEVIIAAAGKAAHLAGIIAANTVLPVIGIPMKSSTLDGLDALLSTVQMPGGIPVATVAIDGAENAALLAIEILSVKYPELREKLKKARKLMKESVSSADAEIKARISEL